MILYVFEDSRNIANCFGVVESNLVEAYKTLEKMGVESHQVALIYQVSINDPRERRGVVFMVEE